MRHDEYEPLMRRLIALFPQRPISVETIAAYWELLHDMDSSVFAAAARDCAETCDWFPTVKQIRESGLRALSNAGVIPADPSAAWQRVMAVARSWHPQSMVRDCFDEATWQAVQSIGGIRVVALADDGAEVARIERQFRDAYNRQYQQATRNALMMPLPADEHMAMLPNGRTA